MRAEYVDGTKMDRTWKQSKEILNLAHKKSPLPPDVRRELLEKQRETYYLRRRQRRAGVFKVGHAHSNGMRIARTGTSRFDPPP